MSRFLGDLGETLVDAYLIDRGFSIVDRNYYSRYGEIDIIAIDSAGTLRFVEVKSYKPDSMMDPRESVTSRKISRLVKTATDYLVFTNQPDAYSQFDLAVVRHGQVEEYLENIIS